MKNILSKNANILLDIDFLTTIKVDYSKYNLINSYANVKIRKY